MKKSILVIALAAASLTQGCLSVVGRANETNIKGFSDSMLCRGVLYAYNISTHPEGIPEKFYLQNARAVPLYLKEIENRNQDRQDKICVKQYMSVKSVWNEGE